MCFNMTPSCKLHTQAHTGSQHMKSNRKIDSENTTQLTKVYKGVCMNEQATHSHAYTQITHLHRMCELQTLYIRFTHPVWCSIRGGIPARLMCGYRSMNINLKRYKLTYPPDPLTLRTYEVCRCSMSGMV